MTQSAPAAIALARSPEYLMPPSAITGVPFFFAASTVSMMAVSCGTPTPATMRVVQIEPGPMPTLIASAPASISALAPSAVAILPATTCTAFDCRLMRVTASSTRRGMAVRGVDHDKVDAGVDQGFAARKTRFADAGCGGDPQAALLVLAGVGMGHRLLDVLDGDEADAAVIGIDNQELLDAVLMQEALGFVLADALAHRDQLLLGHQLGDFLPLVGGEAHVAVGEDADQLAGAAAAAALDHRNAGNAVLAHQRERFSQCRVGPDGDRIDDHAGFELFHLPDLRGLQRGLEVAVNDADAARLRHGDRHLGLGHRVHGRGDDRNIQRNGAGNVRADIHVGRQNVRQAGLQQHIIEGISFGRYVFRNHCHCQLRLALHERAGASGDAFGARDRCNPSRLGGPLLGWRRAIARLGRNA